MTQRTGGMCGVRVRTRGLGGTAISIALLAGSGCYTADMWRWATESVPKSRALGIERGPEGTERMILGIRGCGERPDGLYALEIPGGWRERPRRASPWGSDIEETSEPAASLVPVAGGETRRDRQRAVRLDFESIVNGAPPPPRCTYGVVLVPGTHGYALAVFGYDARPIGEERARCLVERNMQEPAPRARSITGLDPRVLDQADRARWEKRRAQLVETRARRGGWVHLGGVGIDPGLAKPGRVLIALCPGTYPGLPFILIADLVALEWRWLSGLETGDYSSPPNPREVPGLIKRLKIPAPEERAAVRAGTRADDGFYAPAPIDYGGRCAKAARKLRECGAHGRAAVPPLRALASNADPRVRSQALGTLQAFGALDEATLAAMLGSPDAAVRRDAAFHLRGKGSAEAAALLDQALRDEDPAVRAEAEKALGRTDAEGGKAADEVLDVTP